MQAWYLGRKSAVRKDYHYNFEELPLQEVRPIIKNFNRDKLIPKMPYHDNK